MSRSRKKTNIGGITCCESEKKDKQFANRKLRRINKTEVRLSKDIFTIKRESSNVWSFGKDGKRVFNDPIHLRK